MRWHYFLSRYLDEKPSEYTSILFKFGELSLPYEDNIEVYALNLKTALIMHLVATNNFEEAFEHVRQLYSIYKDLNTTTLFMVSSLLCSLERFEEGYYIFVEKINDLKNLNVDDMLHVNVSDDYLENCIQFTLARLDNIRKNHG